MRNKRIKKNTSQKKEQKEKHFTCVYRYLFIAGWDLPSSSTSFTSPDAALVSMSTTSVVAAILVGVITTVYRICQIFACVELENLSEGMAGLMGRLRDGCTTTCWFVLGVFLLATRSRLFSSNALTAWTYMCTVCVCVCLCSCLSPLCVCVCVCLSVCLCTILEKKRFPPETYVHL